MAQKVSSTPLILASASPRRRELLSLLPFPFQVTEPNVDEAAQTKKAQRPEELARLLALAKAEFVADRTSDQFVVAADTLVVLDGKVLGKPKDAHEATDMLKRLREKEHLVITGLALVNRVLNKTLVAHTVTKGWARPYSDDEIATYVATGDPLDKAGACEIQHPTFRPVPFIHGCYCNCVGLPLCSLLALLKEAGLPRTPDPPSGPQDCPFCQRMVENAPFSPKQIS